MANVNPPPTYADVILIDEKAILAGKPTRPRFNPIWLKWFVDLASFITASGGISGANHESLAGLLGGAANDHWHMTQAEHDATIAAAAVSITTYDAQQLDFLLMGA